jgi:hypothetical protein
MTLPDIGPGRDEALGAALRAALDDGGDAAFAARVREAIGREPRAGTWDVLALWWRPGLAAAAALLIGLLATWRVAAPDEVAAAPFAEQILAIDGVPSGDAVLAGFGEGR